MRVHMFHCFDENLAETLEAMDNAKIIAIVPRRIDINGYVTQYSILFEMEDEKVPTKSV